MLLRRSASALAVIALAACEPDVHYNAGGNTAAQNYAAFDPSTSEIPQPNDLALAQAAAVPGAQGELLKAFAQAGGFPNDQEVPITIDLVNVAVDPNTAATTRTQPTLDTTSLHYCTAPGQNCNVVVIALPSSGALPPTYAPLDAAATQYVAAGDHGTLILHKALDPSGSRRWAAGVHYVAAIRGGPNGVTVNGGNQIYPQPAMYLLEQGQDLTLPQNQGLIPGNSSAEKAATAAQLETIRKQYEAGPYQTVAALGGFQKTDIAAMTTFQIAPATTTYVAIDPSSNTAPLPSDFLLDPTKATPAVRDLSAVLCPPTTPGGAQPPCPAAQGLQTLDGFSTTGMIIAQLAANRPVVAGTVNKDTVFLYDLSNPNAPTRVLEVNEAAAAHKAAGFVAEPPQVQGPPPGGAGPNVSPVIGLQPAVPAEDPASGVVLPVQPLKEATEYAVVVTDGVKDALSGGQAISRSTVSKILLFSNPVAQGGKSLLAGVSDADASALERMRLGVGPVATALQTEKAITKDHIVSAYTFRTQSITGRAAFANPAGPTGLVQIAAIPYSQLLPGVCTAAGLTDCTKPVPGTTKIYTQAGTEPGVAGTIASVFDKYGVDQAVGTSNIDTVIESQIVTVNKLSNATGAFDPDPTKAVPEVINVLLATPAATNTNTQACSGPLAAFAPAKCVPLVVFHHGLGASRSSVLTVADAVTVTGMAIVATDAPKHGDRSFCSALNSLALTHGATPDAECVPGNHCVPDPTLAGGSTDAPAAGGLPSGAPGLCRQGTTTASPLGTFANRPTLCLSGACTFPANAGTPAASSEYFISGNFFRTRDTIRQDTIDFSQLIQVVEQTPAAPPIAGADIFNALVGRGVIISPSPATTFWVGQSLGSILGTLNVAANPRVSKAVFNVGGGTLVDTFTNAPAFKSSVDALFLSLGIDRSQIATNPAVAQKYLLTLTVAKWILDPADPINFAGHITTDTLPNLLGPGALGGNQNGSVPQTAKAVLAQYAACDNTVPNPFNTLLAGVMGLATAPTQLLDLTNPNAAGPLSTLTSTGNIQYFLNTASPAINDPSTGATCPAGRAVPHAFVTSHGATGSGQDANIAFLTGAALQDAATFLLTGTLPPAVEKHP
jgi:hypothetical protein